MQQQDFTTLCAVCHALREGAVPSRFEKAQQTGSQTLHFGLRTLAESLWLELSWAAEAPRLHRSAPPDRSGAGSTLAQQVQHALRGLALVAVEQPAWERIVRLCFSKRPGATVDRQVVLELMGRHSNVFLLDGNQRILGIGRQVKAQHSRVRPLGNGDCYVPPPVLVARQPAADESCGAWRQHLLHQQHPAIGQALQQGYAGVSPSLVRQLCAAAAVDREATTAVLAEASWQALHRQWRLWLEALAARRFQFRNHGDGGYSVWQPAATADGVPTDAEPPGPARTVPLDLALAAFHNHHLLHSALQRDRQRLEQRLAKVLHKKQLVIDDLERNLESIGSHTRLQRQADLLMCRGDGQRRGLSTLLLQDPMGGASEQVNLDPGLTLNANAQRLYGKARKLKRSRQAIAPRLLLYRQQHEQLQATGEELTSQWDAADPQQQRILLSACEAALVRLGLDGGKATGEAQPGGMRSGKVKPPDNAGQPLQLRSPGGLRLLVGRNRYQNDRVSMQGSRRGDLWFHAQQVPGSHVVLKAGEGAAPAEADLQAAADMAAYFSRGRGSRVVAVVCSDVSTLQRVPGAGPGPLRFVHKQLLWGHPDAAAALIRNGQGGQRHPGSRLLP